MKIVNAAVIVAVLTAGPAVQAQQQDEQVQPEQQSVPVPYKASRGADQLSIELPERYRRMWPDEFDNYKRGYTLANGQTLSIAARGSSMYARIDDDSWHKIVAAAPNTFVALDRQLEMEINLLDDERVSGWVTMTLPPERLANGEIVPERVVRYAMR